MTRQFIYAFLVLLCMAVKSEGQTLTAAEYFINTDPGVGNGKPIPIVADSTISTSFTIPATGLAAGFYQLYIRVKDKNNNWSIANQATFFVDSAVKTSTPVLTAAEYFIDTDPGIGNGHVLAIQSGDSVSAAFSISTAGLAAGFHQLYVRVKDQNNQWSLAALRTFFINANLSNGLPPIVAAEYYIDTDSGAGNNMPVGVLKGTTVDTSYNFMPADLSLGAHTMNLRVKDSAGNWSLVDSRAFSVCTTYGPLSAFNFAVSDSNASFVNNSQYASGYRWEFGDGDTSNLVNPLHTYDPGVYNACLVSRNACFAKGDTLCQTVTIKGLSGINTNTGGNTGQVTASITGGGFVPGMQVYLQEGGQSIPSDTLVIQNGSLMTAVFDLSGKPVGSCDVIAVFPNGKTDTLYNGFTITAGVIPNLWVNITGSNVLRLGFNQVYTITYGNSGNTDALFVPLLIDGLPVGTNIQIQSPIFRIDSLPGLDTLQTMVDTIRRTFDDSLYNESFRLLYLSKIPAGSSGTMQVIFQVPFTTPLHSTANIQVILGQPLSDTTTHILPELSGPGTVTATPRSAMAPTGSRPVQWTGIPTPLAESSETSSLDWNSWIDCLDNVADLAAGLVGLTDLQNCLLGGLGVAKTIITKFEVGTPEGPTVLDGTDVFMGTYETAKSCLEAAGKVFLPETRIYDLIKYGMTVTKWGLGDYKVITSCQKPFTSLAKNLLHILFGNDHDPNLKTGIGDSSANHYTRVMPLSYIVNFENDPAANANAQTIIITDTLNASYDNYSSFGFNSVMIGDSVFCFANPVKSFVHDFDFSATYGVKARVTATFDSVAGVAQWAFFSIDPATNQQTTNALAGFLPPDVNFPQGSGYVSFTVNPATGITTGDQVCNKATIIFDANPPIVTDCWVNVFDVVKPVSQVLPLPAQETTDSFAVSWAGSDNLSGVRVYDVFVSINDSAYTPWLVGTYATGALYPGTYNSTYSFFSIATDGAGNIESPKTVAEAQTTVGSGSPLPITLVNVSLKCAGSSVILQWQTTSEVNGGVFQIQKSANGSGGWNTIGIVDAAGSSTSLQSYQYTDAQGDGGAFYRLCAIDNNGNATYSQVLSSDCAIPGVQVQVFPIPAKNTLNILITTNDNDMAVISLVDVNGKTIRQLAGSLQIGVNTLSLDVSAVAAGEYFLKMQGGRFMEMVKVVVVR